MKEILAKNILKKLLSFDLQDRIKEVEKDVNSKKDEYASINSIDLANALGVPLNAIDGSGDGEWTEWGQYGYVFVEPFKKVLKTYGIDEMLELLEIEISTERSEYLQQKYSELSKRKVINLLTEDEKYLIELKIALKDLYDEDGDAYSCIATYDIENSGLRFKASLNGDYSTIDNLQTPYHLRDEVAFSEIWFFRNNDDKAYYEEHIENKGKDVKDVWIEAFRNRGDEDGDVLNYLEYIHWIKEHIKAKPDIVLFRFFNDE